MQYRDMQISSTFNLIREHSDQVFSISHNLAYCNLAKVLISGGQLPPSVSVVEKSLAMEWLPSNHLSSSIKMRKKAIIRDDWPEIHPVFLNIPSVCKWPLKRHYPQNCLFSGIGCQSKVVEEESLSQMVTKVRTHPSLFSSFKNNLRTKIKYKAGFVSLPFSNRQENQAEKPSIKLNIPKSVQESKNSSVISRLMCDATKFSPPS